MIDQLLKATQEEDWFKASTLLYKHWCLTCPTAYPSNVDQPWENQVDDSTISKDLLYPLAAMFCCEDNCTESEKKIVSLKKLSELTGIDTTNRRPGQICGRVFKNGEPNYTCNYFLYLQECATDGTCVLCRECFINSPHTKHKYKMHTSLGCGYCDCGDPEAWSRDFACSLHSCSSSSEEQAKNIVPGASSLPIELETRAYNLTVIACRFIVNLLCWDEDRGSSMFSGDMFGEEDQFQTILFNDETHTYDAVIRALEIAVHCTNNQAMRLATIVDREGRSIKDSQGLQQAYQKSGPLEVKVFRSSLVSYQQFGVRLLNWLSLQAQEFSPMSLILGDVLLYECPDESCTTTNFVPSEDRAALQIASEKLWKAARSGFHQALMCSVLMNLRQKQEFGRVFVRNYVNLFNDFIEDDHEHSVSIVSMAVQVFTVPTCSQL
uniref:E3 ubiquitin-protein ligase n=1 Tax=Ditylenchus dipsaci TaxID=166011 RepID=A0A915DJ78_9BILA